MSGIYRSSMRTAGEFVRYLDEAALRSAEYSERHFRFLGLLSVLVPAAYLADSYAGDPHFDTLAVRLLAFLLAAPLIFYNTKFIRSLRMFHVYFVVLAAYVLPFTFGLMLTLNAAMVPEGGQLELLWIIQYVVSLFLFIQLIQNGPLATVLWTLSTAATMACLVFVQEINWSELQRVVVYPATAYLTALFFGIITNRNVDYVNSEKLKAASAIGGNIAHELRTPLASIRSLAKAVNRHSETLAIAYAAAKEANLNVPPLYDHQVEGLRTALKTIEQEVEYSNTIIDMLLINTTKQRAQHGANQTTTMSSIVNEAVQRYPFNNSGERSLVRLKTVNDFHVTGPRVLLVHIFFNLLKNGIYYAQRTPTGLVSIQIGSPSGIRTVEVSDTGPGMSPTQRRLVFERFFTTATHGQGAGIGLSFCKMVMESLGGDIQCDSKEGEYTTFKLVFPNVGDAKTLPRFAKMRHTSSRESNASTTRLDRSPLHAIIRCRCR